MEERPGFLKFRAPGGERLFANESGGHRWQRVPPTERRGRVHTSTVTVAVLPVPRPTEVRLRDADLHWQTTRGSGGGGQKRNKTENAVILTHRPSGLTVRIESERSLKQNQLLAQDILRARLLKRAVASKADSRNRRRRELIGGGARGDKVRTISLPRDEVVDHRTGRRMSAKRYLRGVPFGA